MTDPHARIAEALRKAMFCDPDWSYVGDPKQLADVVLALPGGTWVEYPEPAPYDSAHECIGRWRVGEFGAVIAYADGYIIDEGGRDLGGTVLVRQFAAALLAAGNAAEDTNREARR